VGLAASAGEKPRSPPASWMLRRSPALSRSLPRRWGFLGNDRADRGAEGGSQCSRQAEPEHTEGRGWHTRRPIQKHFEHPCLPRIGASEIGFPPADRWSRRVDEIRELRLRETQPQPELANLSARHRRASARPAPSPRPKAASTATTMAELPDVSRKTVRPGWATASRTCAGCRYGSIVLAGVRAQGGGRRRGADVMVEEASHTTCRSASSV
jgi:hypothetical protein